MASTMFNAVMQLPNVQHHLLGPAYSVIKFAEQMPEVPCRCEATGFAQRSWVIWMADAVRALALGSAPSYAPRIARWMNQQLPLNDRLLVYEALCRITCTTYDCTLSTEQLRALCSDQRDHPSNFAAETAAYLTREYEGTDHQEAVARLRVAQASNPAVRIMPPSKELLVPGRVLVVGDSEGDIVWRCGRQPKKNR